MSSERPQEVQRWNRDYLFDILRALGIRHIFGVPGTNEIPIIDGTAYPENGVQYIECLHENIAIGAAMGAARMSGKPGVLVVHVTPGIAHSIGQRLALADAAGDPLLSAAERAGDPGAAACFKPR
jgi:benzoylformate decarboxylase